MNPDFTSETCFTCCNKAEHFRNVADPDGDSNSNICHTICQHFWFKEDDLQSAIVCEICWEKVDQFHQFYLDVKKLHEHREVAPISMFIKQEEITIEETQLQESCMDISAGNQKLFDTADCKLETTEERNELPKKDEPTDVLPQPRKKRKYASRLPRKLPTPEEKQAEDDFIKQHTRYFCDGCNIEFKTFRAIKKHQIEAHNENTVMCCGKQHRTRAILYEHVQSLLNPEAYKCEICGKSHKAKHYYDRHKELHHAAEEELVFKCNRCPKSFIKEGLLKSHLAEHETLENETAKCEFCGKCFRTKSILKQHVKVAHKKPMDFICEICSKGFYQRGMFLKHHKTHELTTEQLKEQCTCEVCGHVSSNMMSLKRHMNYMHAPDKQLKKQCPVCDKWYSSHSNLLQHIRLHNEGKCKCEVCGHESINMTSLKLHMKRNHGPNNRQHVCEQCGKEYSRAIVLKEHVAHAHTREHLYQCQHCEKKFFFSRTMYSHRKKEHPQERLEDQKSNYTRREVDSDGGETDS